MAWKNVVWRAAPLLLIIMLTSYFAGDGWGAIPSALVAWGTILLAFATFQLIRENRRIREEDKEHESMKRCLEELQGWIYEVVRIKTESSSPKGTDLEWKQRNTDAKVLASKNGYFESEATRLDSKFPTEKREEQLVNIIGRVSFILENQSSISRAVNSSIMHRKCSKILEKYEG